MTNGILDNTAALLKWRNEQAEKREWAKLMLSVGVDKKAVAEATGRSINWVEYRMREMRRE